MEKSWRVCIWTSPNKGYSKEFVSKEEAYLFANSKSEAYAIEIYGPDDFYDGSY